MAAVVNLWVVAQQLEEGVISLADLTEVELILAAESFLEEPVIAVEVIDVAVAAAVVPPEEGLMMGLEGKLLEVKPEATETAEEATELREEELMGLPEEELMGLPEEELVGLLPEEELTH